MNIWDFFESDQAPYDALGTALRDRFTTEDEKFSISYPSSSCKRRYSIMDFEIVGEITQIETIARGNSIRDRARLRKHYGQGRWRKLKGVSYVRLIDGSVHLAEIHWYEAHGIGKREFKLKLPFLD